ncbi:MAG: hypothetical protein FI717_00325 [SAR202 cluster bacterium]|nr:hypothetical protein [SAR202 cluster bacterium]
MNSPYLFEELSKELGKYISFDAITLAVVDEATGEFSARFISPSDSTGDSLPHSYKLPDGAFDRDRSPLVAETVQPGSDEYPFGDDSLFPDMVLKITTPIMLAEGVVGILSLFGKEPSAFREREQALL